jgi:peptidoglycan/xylan/chitin deacetylase (PgdA/CDA1 family)
LILLHNIGPRLNSNYNTPEEILACDEPLSFDGVYMTVYDNRELLRGRDVTLFVCGDHAGKDNAFDAPHLPNFRLEKFCTIEQVLELASDIGATVGWHSWTHRNLCELSDAEVRAEVEQPFPMTVFAYPYGNVDARVAKIVQEAGYDDAWSVTQGNGGPFQRRRKYLNW